MRTSALLIFILLAILGVCGLLYTNHKLDKMEQIRGWKPGATVQLETVHQMFRDPQSGACWIALSDVSIHRPGPHRLNLDPQVWNTLQIGDQIEIVHVPGDPDPYLRDGIFASDGNFAFDRALLIFQSALIGIGLLGALIILGAPFFKRVPSAAERDRAMAESPPFSSARGGSESMEPSRSEAIQTRPSDKGPLRNDFKLEAIAEALPANLPEPKQVRSGSRWGDPDIRSYRCPKCPCTQARDYEGISSVGWIVFALLLFFCMPLCFLGLLIREKCKVCSACGMRMYE